MALATAAGIVSVLIGLLTMAGMPSARVAVNPGAALLAGINGGLGAFVFGALALFLAQLMSRGAAAGLTGGLMVFFFVLDGTGRAIPADAGIRWFSPFYYYDLNTPLIPGYVPNWGAFAVLVVISLVLVGASLPLFMRRDIGRSVLANMSLSQRRAKAAEPAGAVLAREERDVWVRGIGPQALRRQATESFWWIVSMALVAGFFVFFAKSAEQSFLKLLQSNSNSSLNGVIGKLFSGADITTNAGFLSALVFSYFMSLLVPVFGGVLAYHWATDLDRGRLELTLSTPPPRWRVVLERFGAVLASTVIATVVVWLAIVVCAQFAGFAVDEGRVAEATFGLLPLALITAALVYALASLIPPGAVIGIMTAFLAISYLAEVLQSFLKLPSWVLNLSMYHQYGAPLLSGLNWVAFVGMLVVAAALLALGVWQFTIRDLDRALKAPDVVRVACARAGRCAEALRQPARFRVPDGGDSLSRTSGPEEAIQECQQGLNAKRLDEHGIGRDVGQHGGAGAGHEDGGDRLATFRPRFRAQLRQQAGAIQARHHQVSDDEIRGLDVGQVQGLLPVRGHQRHATALLDDEGHDVGDGGLVVDDQHTAWRGGYRDRCRHRGARGRGTWAAPGRTLAPRAIIPRSTGHTIASLPQRPCLGHRANSGRRLRADHAIDTGQRSGRASWGAR